MADNRHLLPFPWRWLRRGYASKPRKFWVCNLVTDVTMSHDTHRRACVSISYYFTSYKGYKVTNLGKSMATGVTISVTQQYGGYSHA